MKFTPLKFALISLGLHFLGFFGLSEHEIFERAAAHAHASSGTANPTVYAEIFPARTSQEPDDSLDGLKNSESLIRRSKEPLAKTAATPRSKADIPEQKNEEPALSFQDYSTAGTLTRLPSPITNIDLDVADVKEVAVPGSVRLTLFIDADGMVTQVISASEDDALHAFSTHVAEIFKRARFTPGEVNGMAVKAQLEIEIVSESMHML